MGVLRPLMMLLTRRDWRGAENLPRTGGFVACPNHISHVDALTFAHYMVDNGREPYFLGKESLFRVPLVGAVLRSAQQIPVYRETGRASDAFSAAVAAVESGKCVGIYAEGSLTRDPDLWPMVGKTGAARVALATRCPVIPIAQWGPQALLAPYSAKLRIFPRKTMHLVAGPPVDLADLYARPRDHQVLAEATERIMAAITALLEGLRGETAPPVRFNPREHGLPPTGNFRKAAKDGDGR